MQLHSALSFIIDDLSKKDIIREEVIALSRKLNRKSGTGIAHLLRNNNVNDYLAETGSLMSELNKKMEQIVEITSWGLVSSGVEEYCEFVLLEGFLTGKDLKDPKELEVPPWIWLTGLCDTVGELRRVLLSQLIDNNLDGAKDIFSMIQKIYFELSGVVFSKNLVPNLRRKLDVIRTVTERTESDMANAMLLKRSQLHLKG
ncbi:MAG: hypothetical protein IH840_12545 [Candidatus Heimdallarchaeota archaeon]|nr:hypothetical protein [Candidatus Heimdallarchaeota archaeon]